MALSTTPDEACADRFDNYAILSRLFRIEIDEELLAALVDVETVVPDGGDAFNEGYRRMRAFVDAIEDVSRVKSQLAIDYSLVFLGYGSNPDGEGDEGRMNAAYPYESVFTTGKKTLSGKAVQAVSDRYHAASFRPHRERIVADDHIACELEFLQYLIDCECAALAGGDQAEVSRLRDQELAFIEEHLLNWVEPFGHEVSKRAETDFYPAVALMAQGWLADDAAYLRGLL